MEDSYTASLLSDAKEYLKSLSDEDRARIMADIATMIGGHFEEVKTKQLEGPIRELISGPHRITYFLRERTLYFI